MKNGRERGEVVVEASIVVTLVMVIITVMLYVGMILYQQTLISVMANQTASSIAQVYGNNLKDPFSGYVDAERVYQSVTYSSMKTDAYMAVVEQKAEIFAQYRLKSSRILTSGTTTVDVDVVTKPNELLKSQVVVTIRDRYDVPLVGLFHASGTVEFAASGRADCVDILEYINGVEAVGDPENSNVSYLPGSNVCTVTFVPHRENLIDTFAVTVQKGKSILSSSHDTNSTMPREPEAGGREFAGWVTDTGRAFRATTVVNTDMVIYGSWNCEIELKADGGTVNGSETYTYKVSEGSRTRFPTPVRENYTFLGWFTEPEGNGVPYLSNDTPITENVTLYAAWTCAHPRNQWDERREGTKCAGYTIYYTCKNCGADMGVGHEPGAEHSFSGTRCDQVHIHNFSVPTTFSFCGIAHLHDFEYYCLLCKHCYVSSRAISESYIYCGEYHSNDWKMASVHRPSDGHLNPFG